MKITFILSLIISQLAFGQTPVDSEIKFKLSNEMGDILNCDSLNNDTISILQFSSYLKSYRYDSLEMYHIINIKSFGSQLVFHWERNGKVMDLFFNIYDTTSRVSNNYSFDKIKFEEGQYKVRVRNNTNPCETFEISRLRYFQNIRIDKENGVQHLNWDSLKVFKSDSLNWCTSFDFRLDDTTLKKIKCR